ncbi:MAG: branched-chain amino acid transaminase [Desulfobacterota bacterium]|nr:branched-chain amino acid transaminase [Thermodesulfobacteriota bacterium]
MDLKTDKIWLDGKFVDWDKAQIHILTHTLHYGWGVFEGIRCYYCQDGYSAVFRLKEHVDRLFASAHIVAIKIPFTKSEISSAILETLRVNKLKEGYIRPIVFVGDGEMGIYVKKVTVRVAIAVWGWGAYLGDEGLAKGIRAKVSSFTRLQVNSQMTKAKVCGNYVNSILAKREIIAAGYDEAILLDSEGYVSEASGENIFIIRNGIIKTTPLTSILPGITRDSVIVIAKDKGYPVIEERFTRDELYLADEVFFSGTAAEITPVREVGDRQIGPGEPGPITRDIQATFFDTVKGKVEKYKGWLTRL